MFCTNSTGPKLKFTLDSGTLPFLAWPGIRTVSILYILLNDQGYATPAYSFTEITSCSKDRHTRLDWPESGIAG
jgi:hypothetical protein